jgi:superfamily II DNA or RNA helicase
MPVPPTCSVSPRRTAALSHWLRNSPRLVAESLHAVPVAVATALRPGHRAPADSVARAMALALGPEAAADAPPNWLRPGQAGSFRRLLAAVRQHGGALLADPVGSGKTYVALAVARALVADDPARVEGRTRRTITCLVPAALQAQWRHALRATGVPGVVWSHELVSRGRLPPTAGPVIVDESHHFRHPATRRHGNAADWLLARPVLLLSATPVVNRAADLVHQLRLGVRADALAAYGAAQLTDLAEAGAGIDRLAALGRLVIARTEVAGLPAVRHRLVVPAPDPVLGQLLEGLDALVLSTDPGVASLIRTGLTRALASSTAALAGALGRYRALLLQAGDAHAAGRVAGRAALRALGGGDATQLVMWALLPSPDVRWELALGDGEALDRLEREARTAATWRSDPRLAALLEVVADGRPTLAFAAFRDTILAVRDALPRAAWLTGDRAGLDRMRTTRAAALAPFRRAEGPVGREPRVLLATDVAAEGLDLRGVARVVHYDLPWTDVRLVQRAGRARRLGARHDAVEVITIEVAEQLEARLGLGAALDRKRQLARWILEEPPWRWQAALADRVLQDGVAEAGVAAVAAGRTGEAGVLAGLAVEETGSRCRRLAAWVGWLPEGAPSDAWRTDQAAVGPRLLGILDQAGAESADPPSPAELSAALERLAPVAARLLRQASAAQLGRAPRSPGAGRLRRRVLEEAAAARRARRGETLERLEAWLGFLAGGHTAGEARLVERLALQPGVPAEWPPAAGPPAAPGPAGIRVSGLVLFRRGGC